MDEQGNDVVGQCWRDLADVMAADDAFWIERHQSRGKRDHQHAVCDPLAERAFRRPLGIGMLRVPVAGQAGEGNDVGLGHGTPARAELLADRQLLEWSREQLAGLSW